MAIDSKDSLYWDYKPGLLVTRSRREKITYPADSSSKSTFGIVLAVRDVVVHGERVITVLWDNCTLENKSQWSLKIVNDDK